jgi:methyl coenzyme M reductase subunit C
MKARLLVLFFAAAVACGGSGSSSGSVGSPREVDGGTVDAGTLPDAGPSGIVAISLSQTDVHIPKFVMTAFAVTGMRADGTRVDVTEQSEARSSNPEVATVDHGQGAQILIHAQDEGTAVITVTFANLVAQCHVTVFSQ